MPLERLADAAAMFKDGQEHFRYRREAAGPAATACVHSAHAQLLAGTPLWPHHCRVVLHRRSAACMVRLGFLDTAASGTQQVLEGGRAQGVQVGAATVGSVRLGSYGCALLTLAHLSAAAEQACLVSVCCPPCAATTPLLPRALQAALVVQHLWALVEGLGSAVASQAGDAADPAAAGAWRQARTAVRQLPPARQRQRVCSRSFWEREVAGGMLPALKRLAEATEVAAAGGEQEAGDSEVLLQAARARAAAGTPAAPTCAAPARGGCAGGAAAGAAQCGTAARSVRAPTGRSTAACAALFGRRRRPEAGGGRPARGVLPSGRGGGWSWGGDVVPSCWLGCSLELVYP